MNHKFVFFFVEIGVREGGGRGLMERARDFRGFMANNITDLHVIIQFQ